jgi:guanine nucleotide-binding protein subunit alpha
MGCAQSSTSRADKARSDAIDKMIEEDHKRYKRECKILLLGSGESGKFLCSFIAILPAY